MSSILSDADKASLVLAFQSGVDTWTRAFTVYQEPTHTVVVTDPNYNPLDGYNQNNLNITNTANFNVISGRILYDKQQEWGYARPYVGRGPNEGQLKIKDQTTRSVRLKVDSAGYALMNTSKQIQIDAYMFNVESIARPHGLFGTDYYTFYLVRAL